MTNTSLEIINKLNEIENNNNEKGLVANGLSLYSEGYANGKAVGEEETLRRVWAVITNHLGNIGEMNFVQFKKEFEQTK